MCLPGRSLTNPLQDDSTGFKLEARLGDAVIAGFGTNDALRYSLTYTPVGAANKLKMKGAEYGAGNLTDPESLRVRLTKWGPGP
jgi:hypothetical protein